MISIKNFFFNRYLLEHGADVSAINCDQELAIDIAESDDMRQLLEQHLRDIGKLKN
jgi:ankyrin repeat protein